MPNDPNQPQDPAINPTADPVEPQDPAPQDPAHNPADPVDPKTAEEWLAQKRKANAEAAKYRKQLEAANAKLQEYEDKDKSEAQLILERAEKAEAELAQARKEASDARLAAQVAGLGVRDDFARDAIVREIQQAQASDPETDVEEKLKEIKGKAPYLFAGQEPAPAEPPPADDPEPDPAAVATGAGGAHPSAANDKRARAKEITDWLDNHRHLRDPGIQLQKVALRRELQKLQG